MFPKQGMHIALEPKAIHQGRVALSSAMEHGFVGPLDIATEVFHPELREAASFIRQARKNGALEFADVLLQLHEATEPGEAQDLLRSKLAAISEEPPHLPEKLTECARIIGEHDKAVRRQHLIWEASTPLGQEASRFSEILKELTALEMESTSTSFSLQLAKRAFDFDEHPPKPIPLFQLCGMALCTPGNIMNIQAAPKAGKSAVLAAKIAAVFNGNQQGPDTLGFSAENAQGFAVIHFDTEQSRFDHDALVRRAVRRAGIERTPEWFLSYSVADLDIKERRQALRHVMREARTNHGGIFAVLIDGVADLCADPNDSAEAFELVHELHAMAITHECTIITVLHENPGSETGKTRGHLGSQIERKAETNLRLAKDKDGITTIWAERARHCYLPKDQGPCFSWNDQAQMHTSCGTAGEIKSAAIRGRMEDEAEQAFGDNPSLRHTDLLTAIGGSLELKARAAKLRIQTWTAEGIVKKNALGNYHLANS
jgi:hypothetical protein